MKFLYNFFILVIIIMSPIIIIIRILKKKEHPRRFLEKFSLIKKKRGSGNLIWFHCSSVGEFLSIVPIIKKLEKSNKVRNILLTSSTLSSSNLFNKFKFKKTTHQFYPIDNIIIANKFLNHWKPTVAFFVESEIWPEMIDAIKKKNIKIILLNARISKNTFKKWKYIRQTASKTFKKFDYIFPQNIETQKFLRELGVLNQKFLGNLKFAEFEEKKKFKIKKNFFKKTVLICAASTHGNEEDIISDVHIQIKKKIKNLVTIIIPRHIDRSKEIIEILKKKKLNFICRTSNKLINEKTDIFLVDAYGENKMFYKLSKVVFIGGTLVPKGGQNPLEAVRYGCKIVHGNYIDNFKDVFKFLDLKGISFKARNKSDLKKNILQLLKKNINNQKLINNFKTIGNKILLKNFKEIIKFI